jgi:hypothetical protein
MNSKSVRRGAVALAAVLALGLQATAMGIASAVSQENVTPTPGPQLLPPDGSEFALLGLTHAKLKTVQSTKPAAVICPHKMDNSPNGVLIVERGANIPAIATGQARFRGHDATPANVGTIWATKFTNLATSNVVYGAYYKWNPPLYGDLDGDGNVACDKDAVVDYEDFAQACGVSGSIPGKFTNKNSNELAVKSGKIHTLTSGTYNFTEVKVAANASLLAAPGSTGTIFTNQVTAAAGAKIDLPGWKVVAVVGKVAMDTNVVANGLFLSLRDDLTADIGMQLSGRFCGYRIVLGERVTVR